jgi:poly(3-hydroxybutyrate) depolymerase
MKHTLSLSRVFLSFLAVLVALFLLLSLIGPRDGEALTLLDQYRAKIAASGTTTTSSVTASGKVITSYVYVDGRKRQYIIYVPTKYSKLRGAPVVMAFHGGGGTMKNMMAEYEITQKADKEGFIAVFPNGTSGFKSGIFATWNA